MVSAANKLEPISVRLSEAARLVGVSENTLKTLDEKYGLSRKVGGVRLYNYSKLKRLATGEEADGGNAQQS